MVFPYVNRTASGSSRCEERDTPNGCGNRDYTPTLTWLATSGQGRVDTVSSAFGPVVSITASDSWAARRDSVPHAPPSLRLVPADHTVVSADGRRVVLGARGYAVLAALARRPGVVVEPSQLLAEAWGHAAPHDESAIKHQVARLRRKLTGTGVDIRTVRGVGYRLEGKASS
jgi:hypothetical protein